MVFVVGIQTARGEMGSEEIAGKEDLVLDEETEHGLRPVHPRREHEPQGAPAQVQGGAVGDDLAGLRRYAQVGGQEVGALLVGHHLGAGIAFEHGRDAARVVLFGVVAYHVVQRLDAEFVEIGEEMLGQGRFDGVDQGDLGLALDEVGVVAGAEGQGNEGIEKAAIPVDRADGIQSGFHFAWCHGRTPCVSGRTSYPEECVRGDSMDEVSPTVDQRSRDVGAMWAP
jgi:hypothetical protein